MIIRTLLATATLLTLSVAAQARPLTIVTPNNTADAHAAKTIIEDKLRAKGFLIAEATEKSLYILIDSVHHKTKTGEDVGLVGTMVIAVPGTGKASPMTQACLQDRRTAQLMKDTDLLILDCTSAISLDDKALAKVMADFALLSLRHELPAIPTPDEKAEAGNAQRKLKS